MKKIGFLFATVVMMLMLAFSVSAESDLNFILNYDEKSYSVSAAHTSIQGSLIIPSTHYGKPVTHIDHAAFMNCVKLESITIPDSITLIGSYAFEGCTGLTDVTISNSVRSIGTLAFSGCTSLTGITVDENNENFSSVDGVLFDKDMKTLIRYPIGNERTSYTMPYGVTEIEEYAFKDSVKLISIIISDSVNQIGSYAFQNCTSLENIIIPDSLTETGFAAFYGCTSLTSVTIPDSIKSVDDYAFYNCTGLTSLTIPDSVTSIGKLAFYNTGYYNDVSVWENDVLYIDKHLIEARDNITYCNIREETKTIADFAFSDCKSLTSITIPDSVISIGYGAFDGCKGFTSITLPFVGASLNGTNKTYFGYIFGANNYGNNNYFVPASLKEVIITTPCEKIDTYAFFYCSNIEKITIPDSVTKIDTEAFRDCSGLTSIIVDENNINYSSVDGVLFDKDKSTLIQCPIGNDRNSYTVPDSVSKIEKDAFEDCWRLKSITIPDSVTSIGKSAFYKCTGLTSITIPYNVTEIGSYAFDYCSALTSITIPISVTEIGSSAFYMSLKDVYYVGSWEQWKEINIHEDNEYLNKARIHYNWCTAIYGGTHEYISEITTPPTHLTEGVETFKCICGDTYTEFVEKLTEHNHKSVVTAPTCTSNGYTTYTCACGDSYVADYVGTTAHSYSAVVTTPATHLSEGVRTYICSSCGDSYPEVIAKTSQHTYTASNVVAPACETEGYTVYTCECGDSYHGDIKSATGHNYEGNTCKTCGESKIENCSCNCHKGGFSGFIWKILCFFYKLFGMNKTCGCGVAHY